MVSLGVSKWVYQVEDNHSKTVILVLMMPTGSYVGLVQNSRANNVRFLKYTL